MGFRRSINAHDAWARLAVEAEPFIAASGLPRGLFAHEGRLIAFLTYGTCGDPPATLGDVDEDGFRSLDRAVAILCPDSQDALGAFAAERLRRFGRHG